MYYYYYLGTYQLQLHVPVNDASAVEVVKGLNNAACVETGCLIVKVPLVPEPTNIEITGENLCSDTFRLVCLYTIYLRTAINCPKIKS